MKNVRINNDVYNNVPSIDIPLATGSGNASFFDVSDTTATASDVLNTKYFYTANGVRTQGTNSGGSTPTIDTLTVTPSTSQQVFNSASVDGYKPVTVNAMPSGSATAPASISGTSASVSTGTNTLTLSKTISVTPSVTAGYVSSGTAGNSSVSLTASVTTKGTATITPTTTNQTISSGTYLTGTQTISGDANLIAGNIKNGTTIFGVTGTYSGGGASNIAQGTFTTGATGNTTDSFSISYSGTGYPIAMFIYVDGGAYNNSTGGNTTWYNSVVRYDVGWFGMVKARTTTSPTYSTSGADNYGNVAIIYKNSTSTATTYTRTSSMTVNQYSSASGAASTACARFKGNGKTVSYYIGNGGSSSIGFAKSTKYAYIVIYSS